MNTEQKMEVGQIYKSSKNEQLYKIIALGKDTETLEDLVVYESQYNNPTSKIWIRPAKMWFEIVERNGIKQPRFSLVE